MQPMNTQQALSLLRQGGWEETAIKRLTRFQSTYTRTELDRAPLDPKRLAFVRWLVTTGRLTELVPAAPQASTAPVEEPWLWLKIMLARLHGGTQKWLNMYDR